MGITCSLPGVKRLGREADHSPPSIAEEKECVELYLQSSIRFHGVVLSESTGTTSPLTLPLPLPLPLPLSLSINHNELLCQPKIILDRTEKIPLHSTAEVPRISVAVFKSLCSLWETSKAESFG
jgi:hypothetical protein